MNPFSQLTKSIDAEILESIAHRAGVSSEATQQTLDILGPELIQGMFTKLKSGGSSELISILKNGNALASGDDILSRILGTSLNGVLETVARRTGISVSQARVLASALAPALIDALGKVGMMDPKMVAKAMGVAKLMGISLPGTDTNDVGEPQKKKGWLSGLLGK